MIRAALVLALGCTPTRPAPESPTAPPAAGSDPVQAPIAAAPSVAREDAPEPPAASPDASPEPEHHDPNTDPHAGGFTLTQAFVGDPSLQSRRGGRLVAVLRTTLGVIECELFEDKAPATVANFVGLARGVRPFLDPVAQRWVTGRFYDGVLFHRVVARFMIQGGDKTGTGKGRTGYTLADEIDPNSKFDAPGVLAMANRGKDTADSQFFITVAATPHLHQSHTAFGRCDPKVPIAISEVPVDPKNLHRPTAAVAILRIDFERR